jgi:N-acetylmuramoyl-L-alanine amidase
MAKIYTAAGHGGKDSGAVANGIKEKDLNLAVTLELNDFLAQQGHSVVTYRNADVDYGLTSDQRINTVVKKANDEKADFFVDIHFNAFKDSTASGVECYHSKVQTKTSNGFVIANEICGGLSRKFGFRNRGAKTKLTLWKTDFFGVIRETKMSAIIVECCFLTSPEDMSKYNAREIAREIATQICKVFGGNVPQSDAPIVVEEKKSNSAKVQNEKVYAIDENSNLIKNAELKVRSNENGEVVFYQ